MSAAETFLTYGLLPITGQAVVVFLALWWAGGTKDLSVRAALCTSQVVVLQVLMLLFCDSLAPMQLPVGGGISFFALEILPLLLVYLFALLRMHAAPSRAHDAVGLALAAPLIPLYMHSSESMPSPLLLLPLLMAFFLCFWFANKAVNRGGYVSAGGEALLSLALVADCMVLLGLYLMLVAPSVNIDYRIGVIAVLATVALIEFAAAILALRCSLRMALFAAVAAGVLLPLWVMLIALTLPY